MEVGYVCVFFFKAVLFYENKKEKKTCMNWSNLFVRVILFRIKNLYPSEKIT